MSKYSNGKIYKLVCEETQRIYIGSTIQLLSRRLHGHSKHKKNLCKSNDFINPKIYLIEDYPCERKEQLLSRERFHIENTECVNVRFPIRTREQRKKQKKEWDEKNKEYTKQYRENNKDKIRERELEYRKKNPQIRTEEQKQKRKKTYTCECGSTIIVENKKRHEKSNKHKNNLML